jgi:hypothetical protein
MSKKKGAREEFIEVEGFFDERNLVESERDGDIVYLREAFSLKKYKAETVDLELKDGNATLNVLGFTFRFPSRILTVEARN